jgi:hypothetical protein
MDTDITTGYQEIGDMQNQMMALADYYDTEKNKVDKSLARVAHRIEALVEKMKHRTQANVLSQNFHDFLGVDFLGDVSRNILPTNVLVDLLKNIATLDKMKQGTAHYDISGAKVQVSVSGKPLSTESTGSVDNLLQDAVNTIWHYNVVTATRNPVTVSLVMTLAAPLMVTTIGFLSQSSAPTNVTMYTSGDGLTYIKQGTKKTTGMTLWQIPIDTIGFIKFELEKDEPDATKGTESNFYFGASRILVQRDMYQTEGKLVSQPMPAGNCVVDQVIITPTDSKLPGTYIRYYAGIDNGVDHIEWIEADKDGIVHYNAYKDYKVDMVDKNTAGFGLEVDDPQFGNQNYAVVDLTSLGITPRVGSTVLYIGEQMYQKDVIFSSPSTPPTTTGPQDWNGKNFVTTYVDINQTINTKQAPLVAGSFNRFTIQFYVENDQMPFVQKLTIDNNSIVSVYLNNTVVTGVQQADGIYFTYKFMQGVNTVNVYTYTPAGQIGAMAPNIDFLSKATWARASAMPLTETSLYNLYNNTSVKDKSKFAYKGNQLVVNYNAIGIRYALSFQYTKLIPTDVSIRLMAIFTRTASAADASAQLSKYQVVVK